MIQNNYDLIEERQNKLFNESLMLLRSSLEMMSDKVVKINAECRKSAFKAEETTEKMYKLKSWWDLIWYSAPIAVLLNLIFRIYQHFSGVGV